MAAGGIPKAEESGPALVARCYRNLTRTLLKVNNHASAEEQTRTSLESDPDLAAAHTAPGRGAGGAGQVRRGAARAEDRP